MSESKELLKLCELIKVADGEVYTSLAGRYRLDIDQVGHFFVVTKATPDSTLADIVTEIDIPGIMIQSRGGLEVTDLLAVFIGRDQAIEAGKKELARVKK